MPPERLAVIGDPIAHSLSPAMHRAALAAAGLDWRYDGCRVPAAELVDWVRAARDTHLRGFNVTIPHKQSIAPLLDGLTPLAARLGAVNTVVNAHGSLLGDNTDVVGFAAALEHLAPDLTGTAVLFGAGGAARAVLTVLAERGLYTTVVARNRQQASTLVAGTEGASVLEWDDAGVCRRVYGASLVVNATPLGMAHLADQSPLPPGCRFRPSTTVLDLVYGRPTLFLQRAGRMGDCRCADGLEMLVRQGAASFRLWTGREPDLEVMRAACRVDRREEARC